MISDQPTQLVHKGFCGVVLVNPHLQGYEIWGISNYLIDLLYNV